MLDPQKKMETHEALRYKWMLKAGAPWPQFGGLSLESAHLPESYTNAMAVQISYGVQPGLQLQRILEISAIPTKPKKNLMHTRPHRLPIPTISSALFWQLPHPAQQPVASFLATVHGDFCIGPLELGSWSKIMRSKKHKVLPDLGGSNSWISTHRTSRQIPDQTDWRGHGAWGWSLNPDQVTIISGYQIISSQASFLAIFGA